MSTVKLCDRCGTRILTDRMMAGGWAITAESGERFDLCSRCYVKFKEFMRGRELRPDPRDIPVASGDQAKDPAPVCAPGRNGGESGPTGSPAPTEKTEAGDTSSVGTADTFPSRGRLDGEAEA